LGYDDIRAALSQRFFVDNLHLITRLGHDLLSSDTPLRHPSAAYAIAATAQKVASYWEDVPLPEDSAAMVEAHIKPKMEAVLDAAEADAESLVMALDDLARAYADAGPFLKSLG
jgi:hypothetical protein